MGALSIARSLDTHVAPCQCPCRFVRRKPRKFVEMRYSLAQHLGSRHIERRLMAWGLSLLALALLINTFAGSLYTHHAMRESTARLQAEVALFTAVRMQTFLRREIERLETAGAAMMVFSAGGEQQRRLASLFLKNDGSIEEIAVTNAQGVALFRLFADKANFRAPKLCQNSVHGPTDSPRKDVGTPKFYKLPVRSSPSTGAGLKAVEGARPEAPRTVEGITSNCDRV